MKYLITLLAISTFLNAEVTLTGSNLDGCHNNNCYKQEILYKYTPPEVMPTPTQTPVVQVKDTPKHSDLIKQSITKVLTQINQYRTLLKKKLSSRKEMAISKVVRDLIKDLTKKRKYLSDVLAKEVKNYKTLGANVDLNFVVLADEFFFLNHKVPVRLEYKLAPQQTVYSLIGSKAQGETGVFPLGENPGNLIIRANAKLILPDSNGIVRTLYDESVDSNDNQRAMILSDGDYYKDILIKKGAQLTSASQRSLESIIAPYIDPNSLPSNPRIKITGGGFLLFFELGKTKNSDFQDLVLKINTLSPIELKKECLVRGYNGMVGDPIDAASIATNLGHRTEGKVLGTSNELQYVYGMPGVDVSLDGTSQIKEVAAVVYIRRDVNDATYPVRWDQKFFSLFWSTRQNWFNQRRESDGQINLLGLDNIPSYRTDLDGDIVPDMPIYSEGPYIVAFNKTYPYFLIKFDLSSIPSAKRTLASNNYSLNLVVDDIPFIGQDIEKGWAHIGRSTKLVGPYNTDTQFSTVGGITSRAQDFLSVVRANTLPESYGFRSALRITELRDSCD